ncbi:hypothetical protein MKW92_030176 [Papaver armeniacum]|nr:hypothetical protein MKW92_030176 [Papaver armeniacum]
MAAKISFFLGCIIASILIQSMSLNAQRKVCTGYVGFVPWDGACSGTATYTEYQDYPYQDCSWWCLRTVFTTDNRIKCAQITYEQETGKHVCTCYTECDP